MVMDVSETVYLIFPDGPDGVGFLSKSLCKDAPTAQLTSAPASVLYELVKVSKDHASLPVDSRGWITCAKLGKKIGALDPKSSESTAEAVRKNIQRIRKAYRNIDGESELIECRRSAGHRVVKQIEVVFA
jgi:hypothetical protein